MRFQRVLRPHVCQCNGFSIPFKKPSERPYNGLVVNGPLQVLRSGAQDRSDEFAAYAERMMVSLSEQVRRVQVELHRIRTGDWRLGTCSIP